MPERHHNGNCFPECARTIAKLGLDRTGKIVVTPQYDVAWEFTEGLAYVKTGAQRGLIDRTGKLIVNLQQVDLAGLFSEGLAPVQTASQPPRFGFIDRAGKLVINPQYDAARGFADVAARLLEDPHRVDGREAAALGGALGEDAGDVRGLDAPGGAHRGLDDDVAQLAHVARPAVAAKGGEGVG